MTTFICMATLLCAIAALILTRAMWWTAMFGSTRALRRDVDALAAQLREIDSLHRAETITPAQHASMKSVVERELLDALAAPAPAAAAPGHPSRALGVGLAAFMVVMAAGGYRLVGSPDGLLVSPPSVNGRGDPPGPSETSTASHETGADQITAMVDRLATRLKTQPEDAEGWSMLARSYEALGRHAEASTAFAKAERLRPGDATLLADHADALAASRGRQLAGEPAALIERALSIDPKNNKALALAGTVAFDRGDYREAVRYWEALTQVEPPEGPFASQVQDSIAQARKLAGMPPAASPGKDASNLIAKVDTADAAETAEGGRAARQGIAVTSGGKAQLAGTVTLAPTLRDRVSPGDTVFVFARAAAGSRMPLAILRKRVSDLPLQFTLDDSLAMSPTANLSSASRVVVGARVSRSGNAMPQRGDLQGIGADVAVGTTGLQVEINQEVVR